MEQLPAGHQIAENPQIDPQRGAAEKAIMPPAGTLKTGGCVNRLVMSTAFEMLQQMTKAMTKGGGMRGLGGMMGGFES